MAAQVRPLASSKSTDDVRAAIHGDAATLSASGAKTTMPRSGSGLPRQVATSSINQLQDSAAVTLLRPLVLNWMSKVLQAEEEGEGQQPPQPLPQDEEAAWNELRYGAFLCSVINALSPRLVRHISTERTTVSALENLGQFSIALASYGVDKRYTFRPMEFVNATPVGDETMARALAALAVHATIAKGASVPALAPDAIEQMASVLEQRRSDGDGAGGSFSDENVLEGFMEKLEAVESTQRAVFAKSQLVQSKLRHTIRGLSEPSYRQQEAFSAAAHTALSEAESLADQYLSTLTSLQQQVQVLEETQHQLLSRIGTPSLASRIADHAASGSESHLHEMDSKTSQMEDTGAAMAATAAAKAAQRLSVLVNSPATDASPTQSSAQMPKSMFSKLPPEVNNAGLPKSELMRLSVVYEMIETEADYVRDLELMINYHKPLLQQTLTEAEINALFSNTEELVPVNQHLLDRLREKRDADPFIPEVGDAIVDVSESLKVYTTYCGNYPEAMKLVHKLQAGAETKDALQNMMNSTEGRGLSLESFLIKPVQRICKYPLLIRELQKHTDKLSKDTISLNLAMTKIESVVAHVNEYTRQLGERDRLVGLQAKIDTPIQLALHEKKHVRDGLLARGLNGKARERYALLFADVLLICTPLKGGRYMLESVHDVAELVVQPDGKGEPIPKSLKFAFQLSGAGDVPSTRQTLVFSAASEPDRLKWIEAFHSAIKSASDESKRTEHVNKRMTTGALLAQQFAAAQDELAGGMPFAGAAGDRMSLRPTSWAMTMGGKRPVSRAGSNLGVGGTLRGTIKGWSSQKKKENDFANEAHDPGANLSFSELSNDYQEQAEPDMVDIAGQIWRRAISAMGTSYYYSADSKETIWRLPEVYTPLDPETGKAFVADDGGDSEDALDEASDEEHNSTGGDTGVEVVETHPNWRRVDRGDGQIYYYNVTNNETAWVLPKNGSATAIEATA
ncbi:cytochrome c oxidase subunit 1 [Geranomyces michiganensis]|nr:cytochrome c oxidase subunit 1 [Geranomyces michiganensis]